ncbi:hypothetical protein Pcinc_032840 [Petrolisthes cinctipes]|uniref:Uncharacterized protein n=1 Tax=Petrolisthes cinctipes TaxID=88211 RepID=A0AAE1JZZ8_PETCI|nr:hypothetical protein Pcinc_032840 [Petrolisthes cinctipes]
MDFTTSPRMEDLLTCSVCCEPYMESLRHPVLLPRCGHSFCRPCIAFLVKNGCVICPSCRMDQRVETADHLPTEFSLLAITNAQQVTKMEMCEPHGVKLSFWCKTCGRPACGECLFEDHPTHSHTVIKATRYVEETKESVTDIANKFIDALDHRERWYIQQVFQFLKNINDAIRTVSVLRRDVDDVRELFKGVKMVEGFGPTTALSEASKCLGLKWNLQDCQLNFKSPVGGKKEEKAAEEKEKDESEMKEEMEEVKERDESEIKEEEMKEVKEKNADEAREKEEEEKDEVVVNGETTEKPDEKEKCNGEKEKEANEKEKEVDEEETLTEEEKRKRRKLLKFREKMAAATAAAEKEQQVKELKREKGDLKKGDKEKTGDVKRKVSFDLNVKDTTPTLAELKTKNMLRKYAPVPREPSVTPERETDKKLTSALKKDNKATETTNAPITTNREKEAELKEDNEGKMNGDCSNDIEAKNESDDVNKSDDPAGREKAETKDANKTPEAPVVTNSEDVSKSEVKPKIKLEHSPSSPSVMQGKRPRGRLARQSLKRSQTMNFGSQSNKDDDDDPLESDNIKGLDLETTKSTNPEEPTVDNKDLEAQASGESRTKEERGATKAEQQGTTKKKKSKKQPDGFFEMEPEEKERITTELLEVPSLTMIVEGIGGRQAYLAWEKEGLHVYCHQYQDLPYDVLIKSTVLHSLIPTKSPTVFLDVGSEQKQHGRVYITLWGHLRRATNFLHLCLGDRGPSFRNTMFLDVLNADSPGERIRGGDYEYNNGRGGEALLDDLEFQEGYSMPMEARRLLDDLEFQEGYSMPMEAGMVVAGGNNRRDMDSNSSSALRTTPDRKFACPLRPRHVGSVLHEGGRVAGGDEGDVGQRLWGRP